MQHRCDMQSRQIYSWETRTNMIDMYLETLTHSSRTNLSKGKISNHDAALLIIAAAPSGLITSREVKNELRSWRGRPGLWYTYLWNTSDVGDGYNFVGADINTAFNDMSFIRGRKGARRRTYWCRVRRGLYRVTLEGYRRLVELQRHV